jgi:hypothetical protein
MIRNAFLQDAHLKVVVDPTSGSYRMIILRGDHSASVTFERELSIPEVREETTQLSG